MTDRHWATVSGSTIGSAHLRDNLPLQDAVRTWHGEDRAVIAVADGHGHHFHFRSDIGAALAVNGVVEALREILDELATAELDAAHGLVTTTMAAMLEDWRQGVRADIEADPFDELQAVATGADEYPLRPYGTTLLAAATVGDVFAFCQIGDGDTVLVTESGTAERPLPEDPDISGFRTTSLCQEDPLHSLRVAVLRRTDVALAYLCTDGFSRARVDADGWWRQTGEQLLAYVGDNGVDWVAEQLPGWLEEPARIGGDDTSMAIVVRTDVTAG